jgi:hypothetical protein
VSVSDFNFLLGRWNVRHRRLKQRGQSCKEWEELAGTAETRPLLDGLCNIEEHLIDGQDCSGIALRAYDRESGTWSIYWVSKRDGILQQPVRGAFDGDIGRFEGEDVDSGRPVRVKFLWDRNDPDEPCWQQSFSYDEGRTWELNWIMKFERQPNAATASEAGDHRAEAERLAQPD